MDKKGTFNQLIKKASLVFVNGENKKKNKQDIVLNEINKSKSKKNKWKIEVKIFIKMVDER